MSTNWGCKYCSHKVQVVIVVFNTLIGLPVTTYTEETLDRQFDLIIGVLPSGNRYKTLPLSPFDCTVIKIGKQFYSARFSEFLQNCTVGNFKSPNNPHLLKRLLFIACPGSQ